VPYYLAPYVGSGTYADPYQPAVIDQPGWAAIDLRPNAASAGLLYLPNASADPRLVLIGVDPFNLVTTQVATTLGAKLGVTIQTPLTLDTLFQVLLAAPPNGGWKPLRRGFDGLLKINLGPYRFASGTIAGGATIATDNFNRADSASLGGNWTEISYNGTTPWAIASNQASGSTSAGTVPISYYSNATFPDDQYGQMVLKTIADAKGAGPIVRASGTDQNSMTFYFAEYGAVEGRYFAVVSGGFTLLGNGAPAGAANDLIYLSAVGSTIVVKRNATQDFTTTDTTVTTGPPGMWAQNQTGAAGLSAVDDWEGGDFSGGGGGAVQPMLMLLGIGS
jgi:hypothetical protein